MVVEMIPIKRIVYLIVVFSAFNTAHITAALSYECSYAEKAKLVWSSAETKDLLSSRNRYCYAEAINEILHSSFITPFPRLKPAQLEWLQKELKEYRFPFEDPIYLTDSHYQQVDAIAENLEVLLYLTKGDYSFEYEKRYWLLVVRGIISRDIMAESWELAQKLGIKFASSTMTKDVYCREYPEKCDNFGKGPGRHMDYRYTGGLLPLQAVRILDFLIPTYN